MSTPTAPDVTRLLLAWRDGKPDALERPLPLVHGELHRLAHGRMLRNRGQTLLTTGPLRVSPETVRRDWKLARLWLLDELVGDGASGVQR